MIPKEWSVDSVLSVTPPSTKNGIVDGPFGSNLKTIHYRRSGVPIITSGYVTNGRFMAGEYLYVDAEKFRQERRSEVNAGDIVMAKIGARCGASAIMPALHQTGILSGNALRIKVDNTRHSTYYVWQVLWSLYSNDGMEALRTVGAQPAISMANLKQFKIALPSLDEQCAIATALSDVDALMSSLDQLILKKHDIKQATMQQLLTGKQRLPGFSGEWQPKKLGDIARFLKGKGLPKSSLISGGNKKCIHYGELFTKYREEIRFIYSSTNSLEEYVVSQKNDVLMPTSDVTPAGLAKASCVMEDGVVIGGDILIVRSSAMNGIFMSYLIRYLRDQVLQLVRGITVYHLYASDMQKFSFSCPCVEEQSAIASVLSDMDTEIAALEHKRDKTSALKQGMMQELLTGRIRLV